MHKNQHEYWIAIKSVANWLLNGILSEKIKPFDTSLKLKMSNLANGRVILQFKNAVLVLKSSLSFYCNLILNLYFVYELSNLTRNPTNNFPT